MLTKPGRGRAERHPGHGVHAGLLAATERANPKHGGEQKPLASLPSRLRASACERADDRATDGRSARASQRASQARQASHRGLAPPNPVPVRGSRGAWAHPSASAGAEPCAT